jgi:hypothetical protein
LHVPALISATHCSTVLPPIKDDELELDFMVSLWAVEQEMDNGLMFLCECEHGGSSRGLIGQGSIT